MASRWRARTRIPRDLNSQFQRLVENMGINAAALLFMWVMEAYYTAIDASAAGVDAGLPAPLRLRYDAGAEVRWSQPQDQHLEVTRVIEEQGSTVQAVLTDAVARFVAARGALEGQRRPPVFGSAERR